MPNPGTASWRSSSQVSCALPPRGTGVLFRKSLGCSNSKQLQERGKSVRVSAAFHTLQAVTLRPATHKAEGQVLTWSKSPSSNPACAFDMVPRAKELVEARRGVPALETQHLRKPHQNLQGTQVSMMTVSPGSSTTKYSACWQADMQE